MEQVHVRGFCCRVLRLELVALLGAALAVPAMAQAGPPRGTATTLSTVTHVQNGHTVATAAVTVKGEDGQPAAGAVVIEEDGRQLAGAALSLEGRSQLDLVLPAGEHQLTAVYMGNATHQASVSAASGVRAQATFHPEFSGLRFSWIAHSDSRAIGFCGCFAHAGECQRFDRTHVRHPLVLRFSRPVFLQVHAGECRDPAQRHYGGDEFDGR